MLKIEQENTLLARLRCAGLPAIVCALLGLVVIPGSAVAQNKPFPQNTGYGQGFISSNLTSNDAQAIYTHWKNTYLKTNCGNYRVEFNSPTGTTVSEGMGYGMVLTAYFGDKTEFDGLWNFVQSKLNSSGLMMWKVDCNGATSDSGGDGSATDGDTDIGFALIVAVSQWGDAYRQIALDYLQTLKAHDYTTCSATGRNMATNGDWDSGCNSENTSYFMPAYYRVFYEFSGDSFWSKAADDAVAIWYANHNSTTGLIANEVNQYGAVGSTGEDYVDYNGCRIPWRAAADYLWYGTADLKTITDTMTDWITSTMGIANFLDGYYTNGTARGSWNGSDCFIGGMTTGAMTNSQSSVDSFTTYFKSLTIDNYYETSLRALYMLMLTGNFWKPTAPPKACTSVADCDDGNACTTDACDAQTGVCSNTKITTCCQADTDCNDGDSCTTDLCNMNAHTCVYTAMPDCGSAPIGDKGVVGGCSSSASSKDANVWSWALTVILVFSFLAFRSRHANGSGSP